MRGRQEWIPLLRKRFLGRSLSPLDSVEGILPMAKGKKGLVFMVEGQGGRGILRLYRDPLALARTLKVYRLCERAGVEVPTLYRFAVAPFLGMRGIVAFTIEEWLPPWEGDGRAVAEVLKTLHSIKRDRWGDPLWGKRGDWLKVELSKARSRLERWSRWRGRDVGPYLIWIQDMAGKVGGLLMYSLLHGDIALSNIRRKGDGPAFIDLDRARFGHPLMDVAPLFFHFPEVGEGVFEAWGFTRGSGGFFLRLFHLRRLIRALKHLRKGETQWASKVEFHERWLEERMIE
jgi:hypothetical protein